ncbi:trimethylguanosine synthase isoform X1 [Selaginella moellendorffii]|uniref:trimethylguanosine synthase isoform X1 n=2 Tax=Selaginella moellendorffii TaxID=88036 RepID=UPI000D1CB8E1|nr:trimethylguanosine synthase isoform X1 [Selaginella moellendorffii]|eukprot:XP_024538959.1 trimethylguanosine synthase isoform X1 [Selaginella moellendorffii]
MRLFKWPWCLIWKPKFKKKKRTKVKKTLQIADDAEKNEISVECKGDTRSVWVPAWDDYYSRYYYYNSESLETTWDAPEGFEDYANFDTSQVLEEENENEASAGTVDEENENAVNADAMDEDNMAIVTETTVKLESISVSELSKVEKIVVKSRRRTKITKELREAGIGLQTAKYWWQRYSLFSKFDEGIKMDEEGWFSVTPEVIAKHQAMRCSSPVVIDAFAGVGGNTIQFALRSEHVIAIDKDPMKIAYARHNAEIYGVSHRIDFVVGDFFQLAPSLKADVIFLSPPWGGPEYLKDTSYDISMLQPKDGFTLFNTAQRVASNIAFYLPRNVDLEQLKELSCLFDPPVEFEIEKNFVNDKLKAITVYYGEICQHDR